MQVTSLNLMARNQQVHRGSGADDKVWKGEIVKTNVSSFFTKYTLYIFGFIHLTSLYVSSYVSSYAHIQTVSTQIKHNSNLLQL